ncbi:MAG TPA: TlpA disulfide reductase family protein [Bryobacteraceae bacterium]|nr:TlpA disulfide reductase family protein [Bryobacteraceae bacterium]
MRLAWVFALAAVFIPAQQQKIDWTAAEKPILGQVKTLRELPDEKRAAVTKDLALRIRKLPQSAGREELAIELSNLVTEGDPGRDTLQETADTLAFVLREQPMNNDDPYRTLAQYVRYEHLDPSGWFRGVAPERYRTAMAALEAEDAWREKLDFTLTDLDGKSWTLRQLSGNVVLVNFWATWCPPCRKEMPDLDAIYKELSGKGLVILAISDENRAVVVPFLAEHKVSYPILLDPGRKVNNDFIVQGIPKTFVYDRAGHLAAQSIDMRTKRQFLEMLRAAGL